MYKDSYNALQQLSTTLQLKFNNNYLIYNTLQQPHLGNNTFIYTRGLIELFPLTTLVLSYQIKIFQLLRIYYNKCLRHTDKSKHI